MNDVEWVDEMKLRVGYGVTGNQSGLDPYKTLQLYGTSGTYYDNGHGSLLIELIKMLTLTLNGRRLQCLMLVWISYYSTTD